MRKPKRGTKRKKRKPEMPKVEFGPGYKKLIRYEALVDNLSYLTDKIQRLPDLAKRLPIEAPEAKVETIYKRLKKKRAATRRELKSYKSIADVIGQQGDQDRLIYAERGPRALEEYDRRLTLTATFPEYLDALREECPTLEGMCRPRLACTGSVIRAYELYYIEHNSVYHYGVGGTSYGSGKFYLMFLAYLDDDAAWYRDDLPDRMGWYDGYCYNLPEAPCESWVHCSIHVKCEGEVMSRADDHNKVKQYFYVSHPDQYGNLPQQIFFGTRVDINEFSGGPSFSGQGFLDLAFRVRAGVRPAISLSNITEMHAQDGRLQIKGNWMVRDIKYRMLPA